jgi:hypothetical protein
LKKPFLLSTLLLIVLATTVLADWQDQERCQVRTACNIQRLLINDSGLNITGASCNMTIRNTTTLLVNEASMTELSGGFYNYTFTPNSTGFYPAVMKCSYAGDLAISDVSFTAAKKEVWSALFELAVPLVMLAISASCLAGYFLYRKDAKETLTGETIKHGLLMLCFALFLVAIISVKHVTDFENDTGNATLTGLSNLVGVVYIAALWLTVGLIMWAGTSLLMKGAQLIRKQALEKREKDENLFQDFTPDDNDFKGGP